ncbi:hypothetical protein SAMN02746095_00238 [Acidocella aminolytica 101 = DSM 11237]|nr:hypothetical protein SAMN02746095_00238 [Acidocella aminolytica 101 = DSM 11237]
MIRQVNKAGSFNLRNRPRNLRAYIECDCTNTAIQADSVSTCGNRAGIINRGVTIDLNPGKPRNNTIIGNHVARSSHDTCISSGDNASRLIHQNTLRAKLHAINTAGDTALIIQAPTLGKLNPCLPAMDNPGIVHHATLANIDHTICSTRQCAAIGNRGIAHQMSTKKRP